jgi:hypothetical protein
MAFRLFPTGIADAPQAIRLTVEAATTPAFPGGSVKLNFDTYPTQNEKVNRNITADADDDRWK